MAMTVIIQLSMLHAFMNVPRVLQCLRYYYQWSEPRALMHMCLTVTAVTRGTFPRHHTEHAVLCAGFNTGNPVAILH